MKNNIIPAGYAMFKGKKLYEEVSSILYNGKSNPSGYACFNSKNNKVGVAKNDTKR